MARSVADIALMQNIISGPHNQDIASLRDRVSIDTRSVKNLGSSKIAYSMDLGFMEVDAQIRENALESAPRDYIHSLHTAVTMYNQFGPLMDEFDCFVWPTLMTTGIPAEFTWPESEVDINGTRRMVCEEQWNSTFLFNMLSRCPVMSVPSGLAANAVPRAIQIVARSYDDQRVFDAAPAYEQACHFPPYQLDARIATGD